MEMWCAARHCAFESHPLRQLRERRSFSGALILLLCMEVVWMIYVILFLGFLAWGLEAAAVFVKQRGTKALLVGAGFLSCCLCALSPLYMIRAEVNDGDFAAIEDTINGFILGVIVMMGVTLLLALTALRKLGR